MPTVKTPKLSSRKLSRTASPLDANSGNDSVSLSPPQISKPLVTPISFAITEATPQKSPSNAPHKPTKPSRKSNQRKNSFSVRDNNSSVNTENDGIPASSYASPANSNSNLNTIYNENPETPKSMVNTMKNPSPKVAEENNDTHNHSGDVIVTPKSPSSKIVKDNFRKSRADSSLEENIPETPKSSKTTPCSNKSQEMSNISADQSVSSGKSVKPKRKSNGNTPRRSLQNSLFEESIKMNGSQSSHSNSQTSYMSPSENEGYSASSTPHERKRKSTSARKKSNNFSPQLRLSESPTNISRHSTKFSHISSVDSGSNFIISPIQPSSNIPSLSAKRRNSSVHKNSDDSLPEVFSPPGNNKSSDKNMDCALISPVRASPPQNPKSVSATPLPAQTPRVKALQKSVRRSARLSSVASNGEFIWWVFNLFGFSNKVFLKIKSPPKKKKKITW